jgi:BirA family biotin operon repressor/biotin-[acetyl-CoA-carboxylase] ligase
MSEATARPPIDQAALQAALHERWNRLAVVAETGSTNADLLADVTAPDRTALAAEMQTAGRGRLERTWSSPPRAGLTFSVLLRPETPLLTWPWLPLLTGVAVREAVQEVTGLALALKWPNDLLDPRDERKVAGILAQTADDAVVVGVGLNVSTTEEELAVPTASSLLLCGVSPLDRTALLIGILARIDARVAQWSDCGGDAEACGLAHAYRSACATLGRVVEVALGETTIRGTAREIDAAGRLVVEGAEGEEHIVGAGDVGYVRPA